MEKEHKKQPLIAKELQIKENQGDYFVHVNLSPQESDLLNAHLNNNKDGEIIVAETNKISTSKYTFLNCIPKILLEQFSKMANIYFLLIALMQSINEISISQGKPVILFPLSVVVIINGIKDFMEDWKRKKSDDEENVRLCSIYNKESSIFENKKWEDIKLGDILKIAGKEYFPADLVLINSSEPNGIAFVETKNLDGETNLKYRQANGKISEKVKTEFEISTFTGKLECKGPNEFIYEFDGKFVIDKSDAEDVCVPMDTNQNSDNKNEIIYIEKNSFLLRGCSLRQTDFIYGFVVYVGHNTKIMKNSPKARSKTSRIEKIMNFQIILIFMLQTILSIIGAVFYLVWFSKYKGEIISYISPKQSEGVLFLFYRIGTWTLIFTNLVPISLLVTLEMIKYIQGMFISWDITIYDQPTATAAKVQTSTLNEELGQVKFIFSDKTGTLTKNYMEFKKMSIGKYSYGVDNPPPIQKNDGKGLISNFHLHDPEFNKHLTQNEPKHENYNNINLYLTCLATCHTVITDSKEVKDVVYQSSSPDETALVNAARYFKYFFSGRDIHNNIYVDVNGKRLCYELLNLLEYSSERKRMSVIVKCPDNKIRLFSKGADSVIRERVTENSEIIKDTDHHLLQYAQKGLRTLMIAYKEISKKEYEVWSDDYRNAMNNPLEKDTLLPVVFDKIEQNLYLLGSTAIEDQLQDNVDQVLSDFIETGIKVWVLTGDKTDTAKSIAFSCKLITHQFVLFDFKERSSANEIRDKMIEYMKRINTDNENNAQDLMKKSVDIIDKNIQEEVNINVKKYALIVSMDEITRIMKNPDLTEIFYSLAIRCNSVLCCRVTPKQKAQMVNLVKDSQPNTTTLAIGDGANDVNMITSAHIGIGILGVEGRQAARASDYSIGQFQYLKRLLYVHGRESYRKNSYVVCYNFYKNVLFVMPQFWFGFVSYFSGQTLYDPWIYQFFNIVFTCLPIIWFGIYDKEVSYDILMKDTRYYVQGIVGKLFHSMRFWKWVMYGMMQGVLVYLFSYNANKGPINSSGFQPDLFSCGSIAYSGIVLIVNIKILMSTCTHSIISFIVFFYSVISYYVILNFMSSSYRFDNFNNYHIILTSINFYLSTFLLVLLCILLDIGVKRILLLFGLVLDPLQVKAEEYEKGLVELKSTVLIEEEVPIEVNNNYFGSAFSSEAGQTPQITKILEENF